MARKHRRSSKRPCSVCGKWFEPHPRAVKHQKTCSAECRRRRHAKKCAEWHAANPDYDRRRHLEARLEVDEEKARGAPEDRVDWEAARDAVGLETAVAIRYSHQMLAEWVRDAVPVKEGLAKGKSDRIPLPVSRDAEPRSPPAS